MSRLLSPFRDSRGYASPPIKLVVGPSKVEFTVQEAVIMKVPYLYTCMHSQFIEARTKTIELPDDSPEGMSELLHWLYTNGIERIKLDSSSDVHPLSEIDQCRAQLHAYIAADKYGLEKLANHIADNFIEYHDSRVPSPAEITVLTAASLQDCKLRQYLIQQLAKTMVQRGNITHAWKLFQSRIPNFERDLLNMLPEDTLDLLKQCHIMSSKDGHEPTRSSCTWHEHKRTNPCVQRIMGVPIRPGCLLAFI